ncbi:C4-dicarboxylate ABC transporter substrate-binding protein [Longibacter salinarum]|uniref:C4-dicarboxylate ABC transporter substrate-binding protein n=1 Tax=Longibacter salinarum TaxID=1850348 RepID=A0A2A8D0B9_9BACT|nr:TRAP transporter small permease subunit [Longibacter salinarum]PEN14301.1 C4-dicarboxylate ABC transporter substrate-binding protein [Longibacter salinarum]
MDIWLRWAHRIDGFSERTGRVIYYCTLAMIVIGAFNAIARYTDKYTGLGMSSNTWLELQWYLFGLVFLLGAAYTLKHDDHVRVDVLYSHLSARGKAWIDLAGTILFLFPFCVLMLYMSIPMVENSWAVLEQSPDPGGLPRYPIRTIIPIAFALVLIQGVSMVIKQVAILRGHDPEEVDPSDSVSVEPRDPTLPSDDTSAGM